LIIQLGKIRQYNSLSLGTQLTTPQHVKKRQLFLSSVLSVCVIKNTVFSPLPQLKSVVKTEPLHKPSNRIADHSALRSSVALIPAGHCPQLTARKTTRQPTQSDQETVADITPPSDRRYPGKSWYDPIPSNSRTSYSRTYYARACLWVGRKKGGRGRAKGLGGVRQGAVPRLYPPDICHSTRFVGHDLCPTD